MEHPDSHYVQQFHIRISVRYFLVVGMKVDFYSQLPIILGNFLGYCEICNWKKLHLKTFFIRCTQKVWKHSKRK